jgi:hypothetical protein
MIRHTIALDHKRCRAEAAARATSAGRPTAVETAAFDVCNAFPEALYPSGNRRPPEPLRTWGELRLGRKPAANASRASPVSGLGLNPSPGWVPEAFVNFA